MKGVVGIACVAAFQVPPTAVVSVGAASAVLEASGSDISAMPSGVTTSSEAPSAWASTLEDDLELEQARRGKQQTIREIKRNVIA
jgi:hypothetical protein